MVSRRDFIRQSTMAGFALGLADIGKAWQAAGDGDFLYASDFIKAQLAAQRPVFTLFSTDSLGGKQFSVSPLTQETAAAGTYTSRISGDSISYFNAGAPAGQNPAWQFSFQPRSFTIRSNWSEGNAIAPFVLSLAQRQNHCTVLGTISPEQRLSFPCLLHLPAMGSFRISCNRPGATVLYDAFRFHGKDENKGESFISLHFDGASADQKEIIYTFESAVIHPDIPKLNNDPRFDGWRRNYINIFQLNPRRQVLANNSASDPCAFTLYMYAEMARKTPALAAGLTALDLIRNSADRYLQGMKGYGQVGYNPPSGWLSEYDSSDSAPSLIISACYYILDTKDHAWAEKNYAGIKAWADKMIATDTSGNGLVKYGYSGNADSWDGKPFKRPANWWDTIGFGHEDAYSNALAYRACTLLAEVAAVLNNNADRDYLNAFAQKLKSNYYTQFYNPATGVLAGWKSRDGKLHDYYFLFVSGTAITYGLIDKKQGRAIMRRLLTKMKEVGYTDFRLGLPGNLIPIRREDYTHHLKRWGYGEKEDGSDGFQVYENGGATGCYAWFTINALYKLGMRKEAESILLPMIDSYKTGGFEGRCPDSIYTKDWKTWNGECWGYEGFLVDNYLPLLAAGNL